MAGAARKNEAIVIAFGFERRRHVAIGDDPVALPRFGRGRAIVVLPHFQKDAQVRARRRSLNELWIFPSAGRMLCCLLQRDERA